MENLEGLSNAGEAALMGSIATTRKKSLGEKRARMIAAIAAGRESAVDKEMANRMTQAELRPFSRKVAVQFLAAGSPPTIVDLTANTAKPYPVVNGAQSGDQPEDDGVLFINEVAIEFAGDLLLNSLKQVRNNLGVRIYYPGGKRIRTVPLSDVMQAGNIYARDAGAYDDTGTVLVPGTHHIVTPARGLLAFNPDEQLIVKPKESEVQIELFVLPGFTLGAFTAEVNANHYWYATFRGERLSKNHDKA